MKHNIFETRQRAQELMQQALNIWRASDQNFNLEGLEKDPVFSVIMSALAYQANILDSEVEELKAEILEEFEKSLSTDALGCAVPTTVIIKTNAKDAKPVRIDSTMPFSANGDADLLPIIQSTVFNVQNVSVTQIDGRRWNVHLELPEPVSSLQGMTFAIPQLPYHDLTVTVMDGDGEKALSIIKPWEPANMPLTEPFSLDTLLYNRKHAVNSNGAYGNLSPYYRNVAMDLFAKQELSLYMFEGTETLKARKQWDMIFEFEGVGEKFAFNNTQITFNVLLLANVNIRTAVISKASPMARLVNSEEDGDFLYLLHPDTDQLFSSLPVMVRRVNVDRFNGSRLVKLLAYLIGKYNTDYYAFHKMNATETEENVKQLSDALYALQERAQKNNSVSNGVYAMIPADKRNAMEATSSLTVRYLTTPGGRASDKIRQETAIVVPGGLDAASTKQIVAPVKGLDELRDSQAEISLRRYLMTSNDRLVTPADLKMFCYNELLIRYSIVADMILNISVKHERMDMGSYHNYCIKVSIILSPNNFVKRAFEGRIESVESYLQKMMQVRTAGIYPIRVSLKLSD